MAAKLKQWGESLSSPRFGYYASVVAGEFDKAAEFLRKSGTVAGESAAKMLEADLFRRKGDFESARSLWRSVVAMTNVGERAFAAASINLGDIPGLRKAYEAVTSLDIRRMVGLKLGSELVQNGKTAAEGEEAPAAEEAKTTKKTTAKKTTAKKAEAATEEKPAAKKTTTAKKTTKKDAE
mgnify:CR=1 FL=1